MAQLLYFIFFTFYCPFLLIFLVLFFTDIFITLATCNTIIRMNARQQTSINNHVTFARDIQLEQGQSAWEKSL